GLPRGNAQGTSVLPALIRKRDDRPERCSLIGWREAASITGAARGHVAGARRRRQMRNYRAITAALCLAVAFPAFAEEEVSYASYGGAYQEGVRKAILDHLPQDHGMKVVDYVLSGGIRDIRTKVK